MEHPPPMPPVSDGKNSGNSLLLPLPRENFLATVAKRFFRNFTVTYRRNRVRTFPVWNPLRPPVNISGDGSTFWAMVCLRFYYKMTVDLPAGKPRTWCLTSAGTTAARPAPGLTPAGGGARPPNSTNVFLKDDAVDKISKFQREMERLKLENQRLLAENFEMKEMLRNQSDESSSFESSTSSSSSSSDSDSDTEERKEESDRHEKESKETSEDNGYESNLSVVDTI